MKRDRRFWRFVVLIALAHLALLFELQQWSRATSTPEPESITWLSADEGESASANDESPEPTASPRARQELDERLVKPPSAKSEIQLPTPTPTPRPKQTPRPTPKPTPKRESTPKKKPKEKPTASPKKKPSASPAKKKAANASPKPKASPAKTGGSSGKGTGSAKGTKGSASGGSASGKAPGWYGDMLHDRFYKAWQQPQTVVATGVKLSATARIRIEKDGRVSDFKIIRPSGNIVVDDSVKAVAGRVARVDALPASIAGAAPYSVDINFALNADK
ncbi:MAG: TonB C-terminal domain-containing protein [Verrucomicrobiota bacterium]|nr:TonB C-terminal domain-containing protein [Verrucomicrobiota bacterium]